MAIYGSQPERALQIIDSAVVAGHLTDYRADLLRAMVFSKSCNMQQQDSAIILLEALLHHEEADRNVDFRQDVLELLVNASRERHDYKEIVHWTVELTQLLRGQHLETEVLRTEADLGLAMTHIGQTDEGLSKINHAIQQLEGIRKFNEMDAWLIAVKRKIYVLAEQGGQEGQIVALADRMQARLNDYAQHPADYHDGTYREPAREDIPDYWGFYNAQAIAFKANAYAVMGDHAAARREMDAFSQSQYSKTLDGRLTIAKVKGRLGDYAAMLATYEEAERSMMSEGDTLNNCYAELLYGRAEAIYALGRMAEYRTLMQRYTRLRQALDDTLLRSKAHSYAARYHAQEQQMEIQQRDAEIRLSRTVTITTAVIALLAVGFAAYYFRQQCIIRRKNRALVEQMTEAVEYKKRWEDLISPSSPKERRTDNPDAELCQDICDTIRNECLYLSPQFDRQAAMEHFHLTKERIGAAFSHGSEYASIADFINCCRLEYAKELLITSPETTIDDIASASGFGTRRTFSRLFKDRYSITPTEYRSQYKSGEGRGKLSFHKV